ncbi:MAG: Na/Pi cotransporter family protein [Bacteroidia bacterium]|nr:MAG: Na/Pi cotransporter family protein [Bacteroidia bacterium]
MGLSSENTSLSGTCGQSLPSPIKVRVRDGSGRPVSGIQVAFRIIAQPDLGSDASLSHLLVSTDSSGQAQTELILGSKPGPYRVAGRIEEGFPDNEVIFTAKASRKNWIWILLISLSGGLGLFLFGMHAMSEGMQQSAGERMRSILENVTRNRIVGAGIGTLVTTIIQSSSATSVMLVSFVNAGLMQFRKTIPVLLGAAIGTTITAQMIAFKITEYSLLLVAVGFFIQAFTKRAKLKYVGYSLFGFGILFFGLEIMSDAMAPLRDYAQFIDLLLRLESPLVGILVGAVFTAIIQSSSAFVGIIIVLASQGLLSLDACIPLLLGSNVGTTVTALLASMRANAEAKKVALAFLLIKFISVLIFAGWTVQLGKLLQQLTPEASLPRLIANAHTLINGVLMLVVLPFTPQVAWLVDRIAGKPKEKGKQAFGTLYLDQGLTSTPSLALNLAKQEILRMGNIVRTMFSLVIPPFLKKDASTLGEIYKHEQEVNFLSDSIKAYFMKINRESMNNRQMKESFQLLYSLNEFEKIADIISGNLATRAERWSLKNYDFSEQGKKELKQFHEKIEKQLKRSLVVFDEANLQQAAKMKAKHKEYRNLSRELEKQHYDRILEGMTESIDSSKTHLEVLALFSTIDSHATSIARIALDWDPKTS